MNTELMKTIEELSEFMYSNEKSEMLEVTGTETGSAKMDGLAYALMKAANMKLGNADCILNGKEITMAGNILSVFSAAYLFIKACKIVDRDLVEPAAFCEDVAIVIKKYMECHYLTSAVDRKHAALELIKRIDSMSFSLSKLFVETTGVDMDSISYIIATKLAMNSNLEEIRDMAVDTVRYP